MSKIIKRIVLLPDFHYPHINKDAVSAVFKFIKWFKPHAINIVGDAMNMDAVNHWKRSRGANKYFEGKRIKKEYEAFDEDILTPLEKLIPKGCEKTYLGGNHEDWIDGVVEKLPQFEGMIEVETSLRLEERGWEWIPYIKYNERADSHTRGIKQYGKLLVFHGQYYNKYHSAKTADNYSKSCAYAHTHDVQSYTKITIDDRGYHTAQSIGCLCNTSPEFLKGRINRWVNAFGVLYVREDGMYNLYIPVIVKGKFVFDGKIFEGD